MAIAINIQYYVIKLSFKPNLKYLNATVIQINLLYLFNTLLFYAETIVFGISLMPVGKSTLIFSLNPIF